MRCRRSRGERAVRMANAFSWAHLEHVKRARRDWIATQPGDGVMISERPLEVLARRGMPSTRLARRLDEELREIGGNLQPQARCASPAVSRARIIGQARDC